MCNGQEHASTTLTSCAYYAPIEYYILQKLYEKNSQVQATLIVFSNKYKPIDLHLIKQPATESIFVVRTSVAARLFITEHNLIY